MLLRHLKDQRIALLTTVTGAKVSSDLRYATVYVSVMGTAKEQQATLIALHHAAGHIQGELAKTLELRFTPMLRFVQDDRIAEGDRVLGLITELQHPPTSPTEERHPAPDSPTSGDDPA